MNTVFELAIFENLRFAVEKYVFAVFLN